ncbi:hypothetical protein ACJMK2_018506 [Sinanodonta woodiana]|uniref:TIR domain-containing protein n=1 Tax=Sinanodonta woodiana TaxID=1069815 RepID=A0ABD3UGR0_SINWO
MRFRCTYITLYVAVVILMGKHSGAICQQRCPCRNITNNSTICNITYNTTTRPLNWQDFFEYEVDKIQRLDLRFKNIFQSQIFPLQEFLHFNWSSLQELQLQNLQADDTQNAIFEMAYLEKLPKLTKVVLRLGPMNLIAGNLQSPLHLIYLDVSDNGYLNFDSLTEIINISGKDLKELHANSINNLTGASLEDSFFQFFEETSLTIIHIMNSNIKIINSPNIGKFLKFVQEIDVSQNDVDISTSTYWSLGNISNLQILKGVDILDRGYNTDTCENTIQENKLNSPNCDLIKYMVQFNLFRSLEALSNAGNKPCNTRCFHFKCTLPETMPLRELHLTKSYSEIFDVQIKGLHQLKIFDFSMNSCKYISPLVFSDLISLKTLLLNENKLSSMANRYPDEFRNLIRTNINLTNLDLSSNGLVKLERDFFELNIELDNLNLSSNLFSYLPKGIFANNTKLEILDVSNNLLSATDWLSSNLVNLRVLNISNNRITTLDSEARHLIDSRSVITFLANNPLDCSCENNDFSVWLSNQKSRNVNITEVYCTQTGMSLSSHITIIDSFSNDCKLKRYIGLLGLLSIAVIIGICGVFYYRHYQNILRLRRIRRHLKDFAEENVAPQQQFLLYLAYSFADRETVLKQIFPELEARLQRELNVSDKLVCISDRDFDVGTSISEEIVRAVSSCTAVLFVISKEFARSRWCEFESEIAIYQQKPIIIVLLEHIKIQSFPFSLRKVCYKWTRMEWPGNKDVNKLDDFWKKLTKAVIKCTDVKY